MNCFFRILDRSLDIILFIVMSSMTIIVGANVLGRFVIGQSISWGDEMAQILLVYLTFLGAAVVMRENVLYSFEFLVRKMPIKTLMAFLSFRWIMVIGISIIFIYTSVEVTVRIYHWIMPATGITRSLVYGVAPMGMCFLLLYAVRNFYSDLKNPQIRKDEESLI